MDTRLIWLALTMIASFIVAIAGGLLMWIGGANPANAVIGGGGAFAATVLLALSIARYLSGRDR